MPPFGPGFLIMQLMAFAVPLGAVGFFGWLGLRFVRARERETARPVDAVGAGEMSRLQETVMELQSEVHRLRERQEFIERLLDRPRASSSQSERT